MAAETDSTSPVGSSSMMMLAALWTRDRNRPDLVVGHFPAPPFGEVADAQHETARPGVWSEQVGADHLDELPPLGRSVPAAR